MAKRGSSKKKIAKAEKAKLNVGSSHRVSNEALGKAMRDLRSSNAAQPHVQKHLKGTRSAKNRIAIKNQMD